MLFLFNIKSFLVSVIIIESNARILFTNCGNRRAECRFFSARTNRTILEITDFRAVDIYSITITILVRATIHLHISICTFWERQIYIFSGFEFIFLPLLRTRNMIANLNQMPSLKFINFFTLNLDSISVP